MTVPDGVSCGQTIAVLAPDGSRLVKATIPAGLQSGDTFLVRLAVPIRMESLNSESVPPQISNARSQPQFAKSLDTWTTPIDQPVPGTPPPPIIIEKPVRDPTQPSFVDALERWLTPVPDVKAAEDNSSIKDTAAESSNQERDAPPPAPIVSSIPLPIETKSFGKAILIQDEISTSPNTPEPIPPALLETISTSPVATQPISPDIIEHPPTVYEPSQTEQKTTSESTSNVQQVPGLPVNAQIEPAQTKPLETEPMNTRQNNTNSTSLSTVSNQKLLLVQVPPGLPAGATMQVEIPGENRTLAAIVPPGAETFHIAYTPRTFDSASYATTPLSGPTPPLQTPSTIVPPQPKSRAHSPKGQKLLLVRVPPGTTAGTTLHVSVPDEPGRILAAQVPPGDVLEFHVSYEARPKQNSFGHANSMLPPASPYNNNHQQQYYHQQHMHPTMMQPGYYQSPHNNNGSNYWWPAAAGMVGGAAMAPYGLEQQHQQQQYRDDEDDDVNQHDYDGNMMASGKEYELTDM